MTSSTSWQNLRINEEQVLFTELIQNSGVQRAIAKIRSHFSGHGFGMKRHLLANAVRLTLRILPELFQTLRECQETLGLSEPVELFVSSMPGQNAYCYKPPVGAPIIVLSAALIERFSPQELRFIIGHELGHALFLHAMIPMPLTTSVGDAAGRIVPLETTLKLFKWSRAAEFSADRAGLICAKDLDASVSAFFKLASGLNFPINLDHTKGFLTQINSLVLSPIARPHLNPDDENADCFHTHPFGPLRVRALMRFASTSAYVEHVGKGIVELSAVDLERLTAEDLKMMDPDYLQEKTTQAAGLRDLLFTAGYLLAHVDGEAKASEMEALATLLGQDRVETKGSVELAEKKLDSLVDDVKKNCSLVDRTRLMQHLVIIAFADGKVNEKEVTFMEKTAGSLDVNPAVIVQTIAVANNPMD